MVSTDDRDRLIESVKEAVRTVSPWKFEGRCLTASEEVRWIEGMALPIKEEDQIVFNGLLLDITDRKRIEESLQVGYELSSSGLTLSHADAALASQASGSERFVTALVAIIDPVTGWLNYASAGHPPAAVWRTDGRVEFLEGGGPALV